MTDTSAILMWFRRDLRLSDHAALHAAAETGRPMIPVFIYDDEVEALGAAPKFRLGLGLAHFQERLADKDSKLILRKGDALACLQALIKETGAGAVFWSRLYDPGAVERDTKIKSALKDVGIDAKSFGGHVMFEPWDVETQKGEMYKVYSPFWRSVKDMHVPECHPTPRNLAAPDDWPDSDQLSDWALDAAMRHGAQVVEAHAQVGEKAAQGRLAYFIENLVEDYKAHRDYPGIDSTSRLSENLALGEITPHQMWHAGQRAMQEGKKGAEHFLKEIVWREFAYHLIHHTPHIVDKAWREEWSAFPWKTDEDTEAVLRWKQGRTGIRFVDAAMRELYVSGTMHNRARMIVASYLTKHLMVHWRVGQKWFEDCLIDWDPASNGMGWQWTAGCGPDASPYFRIFNPDTQLEKFDEDRAYVNRWLAEGQDNPHDDALAFFDAIPKSWGLGPGDPYPDPVVDLMEGRDRALAAYEDRSF